MPLPSTMTPIVTNTLAASTASITFSSIPQNYTDLILIISGTTVSTAQDFYIQFNSDTATNYSTTYIVGNGTAVSSARTTSATKIYLINDTSNTNPTIIVGSIQNYSNSTTYKTLLSRGNDVDHRVQATVGLWRSTSAITSMVITATTNFNSGTTATIYGIKAAS